MTDDLAGPEIRTAEPSAPEHYPFWNYHDLLLLIGLALPALVAAMVVARTAMLILPEKAVTPAAGILVAQFLGYGLWFLCLYGLLRLRYGRPFWRSLAWVRPGTTMVMYVASGALLAITVALLGAALKTPDIAMPMQELLRDRASLVLVGIFAVTLGPLCEELSFRGFFLPLLARSLGAAGGVLLTAVAFSLMHGPQYAWSWRHILLITLAGVAFGVVRLRSGSTAAATIMHATYNLTFFVAYLVQSDGVHL